MTKEEFFRAYHESRSTTQHTMGTSGLHKIRIFAPDGVYCPITLVFRKLKGEKISSLYWFGCSQELGMKLHVARHIVNAADTNIKRLGPAGKRTRERLLEDLS